MVFVSILCILFFMWSEAAFVYKCLMETNLEDAYLQVLPALNTFSAGNEVNYNPNGDDVLAYALRKTLADFDQRKAENIACAPDKFSNYSLPSVCMDFIPQNNNDFSAVKSALSSTFSDHVAQLGFPVYQTSVVLLQKADNIYNVNIIYATTQAIQKKFMKYHEFCRNANNEKAAKEVAPIVDDDLEMDLGIFDDDED